MSDSFTCNETFSANGQLRRLLQMREIQARALQRDRGLTSTGAMIKRIRNLSLRTRMLSAFGVVAALLLIVGGIGFWGSAAQSGAATSRTHLDDAVRQVDLTRYYDADVSGWQVAVALDAHTAPVNAKDPNRVGEIVDKAALAKLLPSFPVKSLTPAEQRSFKRIVADWARFWRIDDQLFRLYSKGDARSMAAADKITNGAATASFAALSDETLALSKSVHARSIRMAASAAATGSTVRFLIALGSVGALLLAAGLGLTITRTLTRRVHRAKARLTEISDATETKLKPGIEALAGGDLTVELVVDTERITDLPGDEIGDIMRTGEGLRDVIASCYLAYNSAVGSMRRLVADVTATATSVGDASAEMAATTDETGKAATEVAHAIEQVAQGAERQVRMIESARRAADEVGTSIERSVQNAEQAAAVATRARETADLGVAAAEQANTAMQAVRDSSEAVTTAIRGLAVKSEQIGTIVRTITGIAEQTNLLALNAAIEAARAGDHGRGFAVVAEEVRRLAEDSQHAAREISALLGAIQDETGYVVEVVEDGAEKTADGAGVVEQTREAFVSIGEAVMDMTARVDQIAAAAQEIAASASAMRESMGEAASVAEDSSASAEQVSASTEETSASTQQVAASATEMAASAEKLRELVGQFRLAAQARP
jgi:methyl-accepting chemotaxis protein